MALRKLSKKSIHMGEIDLDTNSLIECTHKEYVVSHLQAFVGCSALSLVFYGYLYCLCLFHVVVDNDILQRVLKSVTKNGTV